jgi:hypothetical protein
MARRRCVCDIARGESRHDGYAVACIPDGSGTTLPMRRGSRARGRRVAADRQPRDLLLRRLSGIRASPRTTGPGRCPRGDGHCAACACFAGDPARPRSRLGSEVDAERAPSLDSNLLQHAVGNMVSPAIPFVGVVTMSFDLADRSAEQVFGKPVGAIRGEYAIGEPPAGSRGIGLWIMIRSVGKLLRWRLAGKTWPHPFFDRASRKPMYPVTSLSPEQRQALRPLCGPKPASSAGPLSGASQRPSSS